MNVTLKSSAIRCGGCANTVRATLSNVPGVLAARVEPTLKLINIEFDERATSTLSLVDRLARAGFPADALPAPTTPARRLCR